jgi:hypothetical protein
MQSDRTEELWLVNPTIETLARLRESVVWPSGVYGGQDGLFWWFVRTESIVLAGNTNTSARKRRFCGQGCTVSISAPREKGFSRARLTLFFITIGFWRCEWGQSGTEKRESGLSPSAQPVRDGCHQVRNSLSPNAQHFPEWRPPRHHRRAGFILYIEVGKVPGAQEETPAYSPQSIS